MRRKNEPKEKTNAPFPPRIREVCIQSLLVCYHHTGLYSSDLMRNKYVRCPLMEQRRFEVHVWLMV